MSAPVEDVTLPRTGTKAAVREEPERFTGLIRVELPEGALPWRTTADETVLRRRAQYVAGVEYVARTFGAEEPLEWDKDAVTLIFTKAVPAELPLHTYSAAKELWQRVRMDLGLSVRIAAHVGKVRPGAGAGLFAGDDMDVCRRLAAAAPVDRVVLTEDLTLALPEPERREPAELGSLEGDGRLTYVYPASGAPVGASAFVYGDDERLWSKFRAYSSGPDVRLIRYVGFRLHKKEPPRLDVRDVYVPSEVEVRTRGKLPLPSGIISVADEEVLPPWSDTPASDASGPPVALRDVFTRHRGVVVLGDPGFGKTTLLRWLAILAAAGEFALASELDVTERLLPIPVSVGRLAEMRSALGGDGVSVVDAMARYFHDRSLGEEDELRPFLERELERGRCLVLLDGLDEVKTEEREAIRSWVEAFGATHNSNRFVATSRRYGYAGLDLSGATAEVVLRPFTDNQVERYVHAFHRTYVRWETGHNPVNSADADRLLEALRASPRLSALARNPFMLSALTLIHRAEGRLPRHRVQAYEIFARALCETWAHARRLVAGATREAAIEYEEEALPILGRLALSMHEQHPTGAAPEEFVREQIALSLAEQRDIDHKEARRAAEEFLRKAAGEVQILLERGAGAWGFLHLTFQEFFVAAGLHAAERFEDVAIQHLFDPRWEEILRLGVGYMALVQKRPRAAQLFVKRVLDHEEPEPRRWITRVLDAQVPLAALLAAEAGDALPAALQKEVGDALATWLKTAPREVAKRYLDELSLTDFAV